MTHYNLGLLLPPEEGGHDEDVLAYIERQLEPYDAQLTVAPYVCYSLAQAAEDLARDRQAWSGAVSATPYGQRRQWALESTTPAERYQDFLKRHHRFNRRGEPVSTRNPAAKWDYYTIGGRWDGWLFDRPAEEDDLVDNRASVPHVLAHEKFPFALLLPDGEWCQRDRLDGWSGRCDVQTQAAWHQEATAILRSFADHDLILLDLHL